MNDLKSQLVNHNVHKMFNNINNVVNGIKGFMSNHGFKEQAIQRVLTRPDYRRDMDQFLSHYPAVHLTQEQADAFKDLVDRLNKLT